MRLRSLSLLVWRRPCQTQDDAASASFSHRWRPPRLFDRIRGIDGPSLSRVSYRCSIASPNEASPAIATPAPSPSLILCFIRRGRVRLHATMIPLPFPLHPPVPGDSRPTASRSGPAAVVASASKRLQGDKEREMIGSLEALGSPPFPSLSLLRIGVTCFGKEGAGRRERKHRDSYKLWGWGHRHAHTCSG
ncbi:unnamed protein product [Musa acuminata subsp. burmannicoides]